MPSSEFNLSFVYDFIPALENIPPSLFDKLTEKLNKTITELTNIKGIFLLSTTKRDPIIYSKKLQDYEKIKELAELVNSMDMNYLIKDLASKGYHGTTTLDFPDFGLGMIKINDTDILAVLVGTKGQVLDEDYIENTTKTIKKTVFGDIAEKINSMPIPKLNKPDEQQDENTDDTFGGIPKPRR